MSETTEKPGNTERKEKAPNGPQSALTEENAQLQRQRDEYLDQLQRSRAEFANYQKRSKLQADADRVYAVGTPAPAKYPEWSGVETRSSRCRLTTISAKAASTNSRPSSRSRPIPRQSVPSARRPGCAARSARGPRSSSRGRASTRPTTGANR